MISSIIKRRLSYEFEIKFKFKFKIERGGGGLFDGDDEDDLFSGIILKLFLVLVI